MTKLLNTEHHNIKDVEKFYRNSSYLKSHFTEHKKLRNMPLSNLTTTSTPNSILYTEHYFLQLQITWSWIREKLLNISPKSVIYTNVTSYYL